MNSSFPPHIEHYCTKIPVNSIIQSKIIENIIINKGPVFKKEIAKSKKAFFVKDLSLKGKDRSKFNIEYFDVNFKCEYSLEEVNVFRRRAQNIIKKNKIFCQIMKKENTLTKHIRYDEKAFK